MSSINKLLVLSLIISMIIGFLIGYSIHSTISGNVVEDQSFEKNYLWTTAVCNDKNECIDVLIECRNGEINSIKPVSDIIKFGDSWEDPRNLSKKYCN